MPDNARLFEATRVILYHKQATSARTLFLWHAGGHVCAPEPLPALTSVLDEEDSPTDEATFVAHPASLALSLVHRLDLPAGSVEIDSGFLARLDAPGQPITAYLARLTAIDPPRDIFAPRGGRFLALTELRGCVPAEMELLRRAYAAILGG